MKIVHLSDLHLGRKSAGDPAGARRLNALRQANSRFSELSPEAILVAGDVFDSPQVDRAVVAQAAKVFNSTKKQNGEPIPVVLIPGNHDPSEAMTLWETFQKHLSAESAVRLVLEPELIHLGNGNLVVEAYPCETRYSAEPPWSKRLDVSKIGNHVIRVVLAHGTLQGGPVPEGESDAYPFTEAEAVSLGADYVALGHFHGVYPAWDGGEEMERSVCYSGTHQPDQFNTDSGWAIVVVLENGRPARLSRCRLSTSQWSAIDINGPTDIERLAALQGDVEQSPDPSDFVIRVNVRGNVKLREEDALRVEQIEENLRALGAYVERQGEFQTLIDVESLDLDGLPSGAVKEALLSLKEQLAKAEDNDQREVHSAALQLGWQSFKEVS